jgi:uncharacterized protein (UPF0332 family)
MPLSLDLLKTARTLLESARKKGRPRQADLRRAISTAYYAVFHALCALVADALVGGSRSARPDRAWRQAYRALQHGAARDRLWAIVARSDLSTREGYPASVGQVTAAFSDLQDQRHDADYDPGRSFSAAEADAMIARAEAAIEALATLTSPDRTALATWLVLPSRDSKGPTKIDARPARR